MHENESSIVDARVHDVTVKIAQGRVRLASPYSARTSMAINEYRKKCRPHYRKKYARSTAQPGLT